MNLTDRQSASRAGEGNLAAFVQLVERYRAPLISYVYGLTGVREESEELAQEAFCRAWQHLPGIQPQSLVSWIYRTAHNLAITGLRRRRSVPLGDEPMRADTTAENPTVEVHRAVAQLGEEHRVIVSLRHFSGLSHQEIAEVLEIAPGTVRSRLSRAYEKLRPMLAHVMEV